MNQNDINRAFTEKVAELLSRGYQIYPGTMGGSQGEIAHVDLYKGEKIIRCPCGRSVRPVSGRTLTRSSMPHPD